nr:immunoglobulin heavy chain junction region [Mus musculus]
CARRDWADYW